MTDDYRQKNWFKLWFGSGYQKYKREGFEHLDRYLEKPPLRILDIGCGMAWESQMFNKKYNTELWLLDGDVKSNTVKDPTIANCGKWHNDPTTMLFYHSLDFLDEELKKCGVSNYNLVDVNNINIPEDVKFDVITSWLSCGFHYPVSTYKELILKHSHANTVVAMDLRLTKQKTPLIESGIELVNIVYNGRKHVNAHLRVV
jgi:SAM-dependent methyltransferase